MRKMIKPLQYMLFNLTLFSAFMQSTACSQPISKVTQAMKNQGVDSIEVSASFVSQKLLRPPQSELLIDFRLINKTNKSIWFLLPYRVEGHLLEKTGGVSGYEIFKLLGDGALIGRFIGNKSFFAVLIAPHVEILIKNLPVQSASEISDQKISLTIFTTEKLMVDNSSMETIFNYPSLTVGEGSKDYNHKKMFHSKFIDTLDEFLVECYSPQEHPIAVSFN